MNEIDNAVPPASGRRRKRVAFQAPVLVTDGVIETRLECVNVCEDGIGLEGDWLWPEGSTVSLRVIIGERSAVARACVAHASENRMGLRITAGGPLFNQLLRLLLLRRTAA
jgi:hypothetical protein